MREITILFWIVGTMFMASCQQFIQPRQKDVKFLFAECAEKSYAESDWLSLEITQYRFNCFDENGLHDTVFVYNKSFLSYHKYGSCFDYYADYNTHRSFRLRADTLYMVNTRDCELGVFARQAEDGFVYPTYKWTIEKHAGYVPNYYTIIFPSYSPTEKVMIESWTDTKVNGIPYYLFYGISDTTFLYNDETDQCDIPIQYHCEFWINKNTFQLDSLFAYKDDTIHSPYTNKLAFVVKNVCHEDKSAYFDSIFNFINPIYDHFSRHDDSFLPYSMGGKNPELATVSLLDYPLINLNNDTTIIADCEGWVLLSFWSFNCPSCIKNMQNYYRELDSLGYRILEKEGVSILSINYQSHNLELISEIANSTKTTDITYTAQGIMNLIKLPFLGYYYLISPNKEIVYESSNLGDYSELLQAKADWEKQHQKE